MNSQDSGTLDDFSTVSTRLYGQPKYAHGFMAAMDRLADIMAAKVAVDVTGHIGPLRGELAKMLRETDKDIFESADGKIVLFRLAPTNLITDLYNGYQPCKDFSSALPISETEPDDKTRVSYRVLLYTDRKNPEPVVPHRFLAIPFDLSVTKIKEAGETKQGTRLLAALLSCVDAKPRYTVAVKGPEEKREKIERLEETAQVQQAQREEEACAQVVEAERLAAAEQTPKIRKERPVSASVREAEKKKIGEIGDRMRMRSVFIELSEAKDSAVRIASHEEKLARRAERAVMRLMEKAAEEQDAQALKELIDIIARRQVSQERALERLKSAQEILAKTQQKLADHKKKHGIEDKPANGAHVSPIVENAKKSEPNPGPVFDNELYKLARHMAGVEVNGKRMTNVALRKALMAAFRDVKCQVLGTGEKRRFILLPRAKKKKLSIEPHMGRLVPVEGSDKNLYIPVTKTEGKTSLIPVALTAESLRTMEDRELADRLSRASSAGKRELKRQAKKNRRPKYFALRGDHAKTPSA